VDNWTARAVEAKRVGWVGTLRSGLGGGRTAPGQPPFHRLGAKSVPVISVEWFELEVTGVDLRIPNAARSGLVETRMDRKGWSSQTPARSWTGPHGSKRGMKLF
jgi:hypothetical protein